MDNHYSVKVYDVPGTNGLTKVKMLYLNDFPVTHEEDVAMLCALLSRSSQTIEDHVVKLNAKGSAAFMEKFYIGYGHESIGLCGNTVVFVEGCSMVAEKACQAHQKYAGQSRSTRYGDFSTIPFHLFGNEGKVKEYLTGYVEKLRAFYVKARAETEKEQILKLNLDLETATPAQKNTAKTNAFDIVRGYLPIGTSTNVAICLTLCDMAHHVQWMYSHHLPEVRNIASTIFTALRERHPNTFLRPLKDTPIFSYVPPYKEKVVKWLNPGPMLDPLMEFNKEQLDQSFDVIGPIVRVAKRIDYACYRDIQRHTSVKRSAVGFKPKKFEGFYLTNLPKHLQQEAEDLIHELKEFYLDNKYSEFWYESGNANLIMYAMPMGFKVNYSFLATHSALSYIFPLRTGPTVHPVLRKYVREIYTELDSQLKAQGWPYNPYKIQEESTEPNFKRGTQTITEK